MMKYDDKIFYFMYVLKRTTAVMEHLFYNRILNKNSETVHLIDELIQDGKALRINKQH
jgi:hypothetical protein